METVRIEFPINNSSYYTEEKAISSMVVGLKKLIEFGAIKGNLDDIVLNYEIANPGGYAVAVIDKSCLVDASKLNSVGSQLSFPVDLDVDKIELKDRQFSTATITERLRINGMNPKIKFRYTVMDYQKFYNSQKSKLSKNPTQMKKLKDMFIIDLMGIFTEILPEIQEGKQLMMITGLNNITKGMNDISKSLSISYRRALKQAKGGNISGSVFKQLQSDYSNFINLLIPQVFPGIDKLNEETKTQSVKVIGSVTANTSCPDKVLDLLTTVRDLCEKGHSFKVVIDPENKENQKEVFFDGDGSDKVPGVYMNKIAENKNYSMTVDGRLSLFN